MNLKTFVQQDFFDLKKNIVYYQKQSISKI